MDFLSKRKKQISDTQNATEEAAAGIKELRKELDELHQESERTKALPVLLDEAVAALDHGLATNCGDATRDFRDFYLTSLTRSELPALPKMRPEVVTGLLIASNIDGVRALLLAEIDKKYEGIEGVSADHRAAKLAEIATKIEEVERAEELLIRRAEAAGIEIMRRGDAWADALLMTDEALAS